MGLAVHVQYIFTVPGLSATIADDAITMIATIAPPHATIPVC